MDKIKVSDWYYEHTIKDQNVFVFQVMLNYLQQNQIAIPDWLKDEDNAYLMDLEYCTAVSGDKYLSKNFIAQYEREEVEVLIYFAMILYRRFNTKWSKIYDALLIEYNPLENYSMDETRTPNLTDEVKNTGDDKTSANYSMDETRTPNLTDEVKNTGDDKTSANYSMDETRTPNLTDEVKNTGDDKTSVNLDKTTTSYVVGYNTASEKESGKTTSNGNATNNYSKVDYNSTHTSKHTGTEHVTRTGDATNNYSKVDYNSTHTSKHTGTEHVTRTGDATNNYSKVDYNSTHTSKHTGTEHLTRSGNIGVTTSQQMLQSEFEVRQYDFYQGIYNDIDEFITMLKW